jgi:hypothetical protein
VESIKNQAKLIQIQEKKRKETPPPQKEKRHMQHLIHNIVMVAAWEYVGFDGTVAIEPLQPWWLVFAVDL